MFYFGVLIACLLSFSRGQADPRASTRRYKPVIQVTEEIDINDITFTTSVPEFERSSSHKTAHYYNGIKPEGIAKGGHGELSDTSPSAFPHVYKDSYGAVVPGEKVFATGQPLLVPAIKYKPYKVFKAQDGFRSYKAKGHDKSKGLALESVTTFGGTNAPKQFLTKVVPFSSQLTRAPTYPTQDSNKNFIPSPTFSSTEAQLTNENNRHLSDHSKVIPFITQKLTDWPKTTKKPYHNPKKSKNILDNHQPAGSGADFSATSKKLEENLSPSTLYKESPQQSESFLSEISTLHQGGSNVNYLDGVADSLDLKTGERVEFQMYGMDGPQSYKFGFDTGKGDNRHFRFEERDNTGKVKGHYGYLDEDGKMRIMKYEADPITGFHAGPVEISPDDK